MREWRGGNSAAFEGDQRHAIDAISEQLFEFSTGIKMLSNNQQPTQGGSNRVVIVNTGGDSVTDGDKGDVLVSSHGTDWTVESTGSVIYCDGITAVLDALAFLGTAGGIIQLSVGQHQLTSKLVLSTTQSLTLRGSGRENTIIYSNDYAIDLLSVQSSNITIEDLTVQHGLVTGNGYGAVSWGRGIVIEAPTSISDNIKGPFIRRCVISNTSSWGIYDTGSYSPDDISYGDGFASAGLFTNTAEHPFPIWGYTDIDPADLVTPMLRKTVAISSSTTINSRTVTSAAAFAVVRVGQIVTGTGIPHNTRVVAKASNSSITVSNLATATNNPVTLTFKHTTDCAITVGLIIEDCNIGFINSGGVIFLGYSGTSSHLANIKTNCYSFGSYTVHNTTTPTTAVTQGHIHYYGRSVEANYGLVLQTPSIQGAPSGDFVTHADTDGTVLSFSASQGVDVYKLYVEILSANCSAGVDWRIGTVGRLDNDNNGYRQYWIITGASNDINFYGPSFITQVTNSGDTTDGYPVRVVRSCEGGFGFTFHGGRVVHKRKVYTSGAVAPFTNGSYYPIPEFGNSTSQPWDDDDFLLDASSDGDIGHPILIDNFHVVNNQGAVREPTVSNSSSISTRLAFRMRNNDRNFQFGKWEDVDRIATGSGGIATVNDLSTKRGLAGPFLKRGEFGYVMGSAFTSVAHVQKAIGTNILTANDANFTGLIVGMSVSGNGIPANSYITSVAGMPNTVTINNNATDSNIDTMTFTSIGAGQREGLWGFCAVENNWRQIPWIRKHTSSWSITQAGDMWMRLNGSPTNSLYPNAEFNWYTNGAWNSVFGLPRTTTVAGDLPYYSATDTPARLALGTTDYLLTAGASAPSWAAPEFKDTLFRVVDNADTTKKFAFECSSITAGSTRTATVPNASGTLAMIDLAQTWSATQTIKDTQLNIVDDGDVSKILAFQCSGISASTTRTIKIQDTNGSAVVVGNTTAASGTLGSVSLTGQTGSLAAQTLLTGNTTSAGLYRVSLYLKCTTAGSGGAQVSVDLTWNDGSAHTDTILLTLLDGSGAIGQGFLPLVTLNKAAFGADVIKVTASQNVTFTSTVVTTGSPQYAIEARIEALG